MVFVCWTLEARVRHSRGKKQGLTLLPKVSKDEEHILACITAQNHVTQRPPGRCNRGLRAMSEC